MSNEVLAILQSIRPEINFSDQAQLISSGLLDSFDMVVLVSKLDQHFDISIPGELISPENFETVDSITALVKNCIN